MTSLLDNNELINDYDENNESKSSFSIKSFKRNHPYIFWILVISLIIVIIVVAIIVTSLTVSKRRKNKSGGINEKEKYKASDNIGHEFDYVNSYIYSTLGDSTETNEINAGSVPV